MEQKVVRVGGGGRITLQVTRADNDMLVNLNDQEIALISPGGDPPISLSYELRPLLRAGENYLSIIGVNGPAGRGGINPWHFAYRLELEGGDPSVPIDINISESHGRTGVVFRRIYRIVV